MTDLEAEKRRAGEAAAREIESGQRVGLGTGSTAACFLRALAARIRGREIRDVAGVPTSDRTAALARDLGIPLTDLNGIHHLDVAVDGADEVDPRRNLVKGLGGALLREKIVAAASRRFLVIVDTSKLVDRLGTSSPVPVEILPFGWRATRARIESDRVHPSLREEHGQPFRTDSGNFIVDCTIDGGVEDPEALAAAWDAVPGVVGHGLFLGMAHAVLVGEADGVRRF